MEATASNMGMAAHSDDGVACMRIFHRIQVVMGEW